MDRSWIIEPTDFSWLIIVDFFDYWVLLIDVYAHELINNDTSADIDGHACITSEPSNVVGLWVREGVGTTHGHHRRRKRCRTQQMSIGVGDSAWFGIEKWGFKPVNMLEFTEQNEGSMRLVLLSNTRLGLDRKRWTNGFHQGCNLDGT